MGALDQLPGYTRAHQNTRPATQNPPLEPRRAKNALSCRHHHLNVPWVSPLHQQQPGDNRADGGAY